MSNEIKKALDRQSQGESAIEDLSPSDGKATDVRGGVLPPNDVRLGVLPPNGTPNVYITPPET